MIHVYTSAALNYLPKVKVLFSSLKKYHPEVKCHFLLADKQDEIAAFENQFFDNIITAESLQIPDFKSWSFKHNIVEFCTAVKPFALLHLLNQPDCELVIYLDPDIAVFSRLDDLIAQAASASVTLTPHLCEPEKTENGVWDNEVSALKHGVFNFGFYAVTPTTEGFRFAEWWRDRVYLACRESIKDGLFTDQKWADLVPAFFEKYKVLRSSRFNVAPWNITFRILEGKVPNEIFVNGEKLGFYHFTGFNSGAHLAMAQKYAGFQKVNFELIQWYINESNQFMDQNHKNRSWLLGTFKNGEPIKQIHRDIYRSRPDLQRTFPDPFETEERLTYLKWFKDQAILEHPELVQIDLITNKQKSKSIFHKILIYQMTNGSAELIKKITRVLFRKSSNLFR